MDRRLAMIATWYLKGSKCYTKGLEINNSLELAHRFRSDLVDPIEKNRNRSCTTLRILRLRIGKR